MNLLQLETTKADTCWNASVLPALVISGHYWHIKGSKESKGDTWIHFYVTNKKKKNIDCYLQTHNGNRYPKTSSRIMDVKTKLNWWEVTVLCYCLRLSYGGYRKGRYQANNTNGWGTYLLDSVGGRGGGKPGNAQGQVPECDDINAVIAKAESFANAVAVV